MTRAPFIPGGPLPRAEAAAPWPQVPVLEPHHFVTEPMESERALLALMLSYRLMREALAKREDVFIGADLVVYFCEQQVARKDFRAPDGFAVLGVEPHERDGWIVWKEGGQYPDLVIEHMSPATRAVDLGPKLRIYGQIWRVREYFAFDLETGEIHAFHTTSNGFEKMPLNTNGRYTSKVLGAEVGISDLPVNGRPGPWMRLFDANGAPILIPAERAEAEAQRAEAEAQRAEAEAQRAEAEAQRADSAEARATALEAELEALKRRLAGA